MILHDLRLSLKSLLNQRAFSASAIVCIAVGVGASSTVFAFLYPLAIRSLPYADADRLVAIWASRPAQDQLQLKLTGPELQDWSDACTSCEAMTGFNGRGIIVSDIEEPAWLLGSQVWGDFNEVVRPQPALGRIFTREEIDAQAPLVVLSHETWASSFGSDPEIVGRQVRFSGQANTIIGVMSPKFEFFTSGVKFWTPRQGSLNFPRRDSSRYFSVVARLRPGVSVEQAQAEMDVVAERLQQEHPDTESDIEARLVPLADQYYGGLRPALWALFGAAAVLMLISCANVAGLLLTRGVRRRREIATRLALGGTRWQVARQLIVESLLLAVIGGVFGLYLGELGTSTLSSFIPSTVRPPLVGAVEFGFGTSTFAIGVSILNGLIFGTAPLWQLSGLRLSESMNQGGRSQSSSAGTPLAHRALIVTQIAMAVVLTAMGGLIARSLWQLQQVDTGYQAENVLTLRTVLNRPAYRGENFPKVPQFFARSLERIEALPGVVAAGVTNHVPVRYFRMQEFLVAGRPQPSGDLPSATYHNISENYFKAMGIPLLKGRSFEPTDSLFDALPGVDAGDRFVAIVNETLAERYWPNENPIGKRIRPGRDDQVPWFSVIGVVADTKHFGLTAESTPELYTYYLQGLRELAGDFVIRTSGDPLAIVPAVREQIHAVDPTQPISLVRPLADWVNDSVWQTRLTAAVMGVFSLSALLLALLGVYGVVSYFVSLRDHEFGVRMAMGAQRSSILALVLADGLKLGATGLAVGLVFAAAGTRVIESLLFEVPTTDLWSFGGAALALSATVLVASYFPARRAVALDPLAVLRSD